MAHSASKEDQVTPRQLGSQAINIPASEIEDLQQEPSRYVFPTTSDQEPSSQPATEQEMIPLSESVMKHQNVSSKFTVSPSQYHYGLCAESGGSHVTSPSTPVDTHHSPTSSTCFVNHSRDEGGGVDMGGDRISLATIDDYITNNHDLLFNEEAVEEVDEVQQTVQSLGGLSVDTQDSDRYKRAPFLCGNIQFMTDMYDPEGSELKKHYMVIHPDTATDDVVRFMSAFWRMRSPKIVLSIITDIENFKPWKNQKLKDDFQKGIIKAANTTHMWIVTDGLEGGVTKMIGDAIKDEKIQRMNSSSIAQSSHLGSDRKGRSFIVIGMMPKELVAYGVHFDGSDGVKIKNQGHKPDTNIFELNPQHSHFILVEDESKEGQLSFGLRCGLEKQFQEKIGRSHRRRLMSMTSDDHDDGDDMIDDRANKIPVVGLLVQGNPNSIDHVLFYLQNKMPIVILKGSGGVADIIAYAYDEIQDRGDEDFEENFLKPELIKIISRVFPKDFADNEFGKFDFRDKIIECVQLSTEGDQSFMTILNMKGWGSSLRDLDKYILKALFRSEKFERSEWQEQLQSDLQLTMDWNRPDLASEIFHRGTRVRIQKNLFEQSLLKQDREDFVVQFLDQGCKVHKFLNHRKLKLLFEKAEDREFFNNICMERVLGLLLFEEQSLDDDFLSENLNRLIYKLSGLSDFVKPSQLSMSSAGIYDVDATVAERKALNCLTIWAVLMNRSKLAKALWKRSDEPVGLALVCCMMYKELAKYIIELHLRTEMEQIANEFGQMALGVLSICFRDSSAQAYGMLSKDLPDFNYKTVVQIAHDAHYIHFIAHPCCQKWLTKEFFGSLQVIELDYGIFRLPYWFKILASALFVFPMNIWITFNPPLKKSRKLAVSADGEPEIQSPDDESDEEEVDDDFVDIAQSKSVIRSKEKSLLYMGTKLKNALFIQQKKKPISLCEKIYLLWTAPITKFWTTTMFYFIYLGLFCVATLWPTCGNFYLDMVLWFWTVIILMELVSRTYTKYHNYPSMPLLGNCVEIILIILFLILLLLSRVFIHVVDISEYIRPKTLLCFALLFFFYRLLGFYLPVSPTLGPMLLRLNRMIKKDFSVFVRMFLIFMISGGVTIQAILYPNYPMGVDMIKRILTRPLYAMFLTQVTDLDGDPACSHLYENITDNFCGSEDRVLGTSLKYTDPQIKAVQTCPYSSLPGYIITIQYLLICKLVLITLLFAMFALTISQIDMEASEYWKFQRYAHIADLAGRYSLPPPFTIFNFIFSALTTVYNTLCRCRKRCSLPRCCRQSKQSSVKKGNKSMKSKRSDDYSYWKKCTREYITCEESKKEKEEIPIKQGELLLSLQEDLRAHRKSMKLLNDRVVELERMTRSSRLYLESISHKLDKTEVMGIANVKGNFIHVAARQSPYPSTRITRFPVFDKYVPWENPYDVYDPKTFTLAKDQFPESEVTYVDEDLIELKHLQEERALLGAEEREALPPLLTFNPIWNSLVTFKEGGVRREIDRRSWIAEDNQPLRYELDPLELPLNPKGRTGMRGKGVLWRWGPNHVIKAVVTRWRHKYGPDLQSMADYLYVEGKRVLEFIATQKADTMDSSYSLPGDVLHGLLNPYSTLCKAFMMSVFDDTDNKSLDDKLDQGDMIQFFAQFASQYVGGSSIRNALSVDSLPQVELPVRSTSYTHTPVLSESRNNLRTEMDLQGFRASLLYKGYLDDPRNTDNAWVEAEVWNFHYDLGDSFDIRLQEEGSVKWKEVSPYVRLFGNESVIVQEAARIHDAYH